MALTGKHFIAGTRGGGGNSADSFTATNPSNGETLECEFLEASQSDIDAAVAAADEAFDQLQTVTSDKIGDLLDAIADGIDAAGDRLLDRAHAETGLPMGRLQGERGRTTNQTRIFAQMARADDWRQPRIDAGNPDRTPPKPDVRTMLFGVGPVVVFGASNFPLAISVVGTDTVSALAARCPVIVKAHPAHPGTCEILAEVISEAVGKVGLPAGTFSLLQGKSNEFGKSLVQHPAVAAVAFTGSLRGGRALFDAVNAREIPIPFYAEMGSSNPVFILPGAMKQRAAEIATGYVQSVNLGVGQFCTNPGIVLGVEGDALEQFLSAVKSSASDVSPATMLHPGIHKSYQDAQENLESITGVEKIASSDQPPVDGAHQAACNIYGADISVLQKSSEVHDEVFGPSSVVLRCQSTEQMLEYASSLDGHLTATIHGTEEDLNSNLKLVRLLQRKVGRIVFNGFPTGIEVCNAMHHGGPYPATTHSFYTSIGHQSIFRFTKPVCFQGFPKECLPPQLQSEA